MLIGEVAQRSGLSARMLRHYDGIGLVPPTGRTTAGYREYAEADLQRLFHVECLRSLGLSLTEVRRALDDPGFAPAGLVEELRERTRERVEAGQELLRRLDRVRASGPARWEEVLDTVALLRGLHSEDASRRQASALSTEPADAVRHADALVEAVLAEDDPSVAGALRWALARTGDEALDVLVTALDSPERAVRDRAVRTLTELTGDRADAALADALAHPDTAVRHRAALALGSRGRLEAQPVLVGMVVAGDHDVEAAEALGSLARTHDRVDSVRDDLVQQIRSRPDEPAARLRLTHSLAELPEPSVRPDLAALATDPDADVARSARYLLGRTETSPDAGP